MQIVFQVVPVQDSDHSLFQAFRGVLGAVTEVEVHQALTGNDVAAGTGFNLGDLSEALFQKPWPTTGELPVLIVESTLPATRLPAASVRTLALEPETYEGEPVTVTGRFRGRNLYGDLPDAPGLGRWEFVLRSADGAIWAIIAAGRITLWRSGDAGFEALPYRLSDR